MSAQESPFAVDVQPDWQGLMQAVRREGPTERVHHIELIIDGEVQEEVCRRFGLLEGIDREDESFLLQRELAVQRFMGYDFVRCGVEGLDMPLKRITTDDTAELSRGRRSYIDEHAGPITNWDEFEAYPWPDPDAITTRRLEWLTENMPEGMCIIGSGGFAHFAEHINWLMGYETLCYALYDQRDLVAAIAERVTEMYVKAISRMLEFDRVKIIWGSDDMGFRTATLISPDDMREFVLPGHKLMAQMAHDSGRPYLLHSCGMLTEIMEDLIQDVGIDARHSYEDVIEPVLEAYERYSDRIAILGGIDVDFLCRSDEAAVRRRVRETLDVTMPKGGYCLGSGNSVTNYVPVDNYLAMVDEGRRYGG